MAVSVDRRKVLIAVGVAVAAVAAGERGAGAALTLTPQAVQAGFSLSVFASGFLTSIGPGNQIGPVGVAFTDTQQVLVVDNGSNQLYRFPSDTDGQVLSDATLLAGTTNWQSPTGLIQVFTPTGPTYYLNEYGASTVVQIDSSGNVLSIVDFDTGLYGPVGLVWYPGPQTASIPSNSLLVSTDYEGLWWTLPGPSGGSEFIGDSGRGLVIEHDGSHIYLAQAGTNIVHGYDLRGTPTLSYNSGTISDGMGHTPSGVEGLALGVGALNGFLFLNCTDGTLWMLNITSGTLRTPSGGVTVGPGAGLRIATGGTRGSLITADPFRCTGPHGDPVPCGQANALPTLLVTQSKEIYRLSIPSSVPALGPWAVAGLAGLLAATGLTRARRRHVASARPC
jgi:hypothetical protein